MARAHYVETGTLRFFEPAVVSGTAEEVDAAISAKTHADGRVVFLIDTDSSTTDRAAALSRATSDSGIVLFAVPKLEGAVVGALEEFECWEWVRDHIRELEGDAVARQEVQARLGAAKQRLEQLAGPAFGLAGYALDPAASDWFYKGKQKHPEKPRDLQRLLSALCAEVFPDAPPLHNELLNRHNLSSAAARARRNLLEQMVHHAHAERIGLEGFPPEYSMYASMLLKGGFHRAGRGGWMLRVPEADEWRPAWKAVERFLAAARERRRPLCDLMEVLRAPPFGMRDGPIPVLLAAALLIKGHEVALYEDGVFVPEVTIEALERFLRRPETFEIQSYKLSTAERRVLVELSRLGKSDGGNAVALLSVVKSLVKVAASLPPYARQTRNLTPQTRAVRDALLRATDPKALLFSELPEAVGVDVHKKDGAAAFAKKLHEATVELSRAYAALLGMVEDGIRDAFGLADRGEEAREALGRRAGPLVAFASEPRLQVFLREASRLDDRDWREVLGRALHDGKPLAYWGDDDASSLRLRLETLVMEFDRLEELVAAAADTNSTVVSVGLLDRGIGERRIVVSCPASTRKDVDAVASRLRAFLKEESDGNPRSKVLAVATVLHELAKQEDGELSD